MKRLQSCREGSSSRRLLLAGMNAETLARGKIRPKTIHFGLVMQLNLLLGDECINKLVMWVHMHDDVWLVAFVPAIFRDTTLNTNAAKDQSL